MKDIEKKLKTAITHTVPDVLDNILDGCEEQKGNIILINEAKKRKKWIAPLGIAAAFAIIIGGSFGVTRYRAYHTVDSVVGLDVNPSIEMEVNTAEKVLSIDAKNEDAKLILDGMDLKNTDLNVAVNAIIGSMLKNGYISELANSILISVENDDIGKAQALEKELMEEINSLLASNEIDGAILGQKITKDDELKALAQKNNISLGKAVLIQKILAVNPNTTFEELAKLSVHDLNLLATSKKVDTTDMITEGTANDKAYIGKGNAKQIAFKHAGVSASKVSHVEVELDYENGKMLYEVEFISGNKEYDYDLDAVSGEIVKFYSEIVNADDLNEKDDVDDDEVDTDKDDTDFDDDDLEDQGDIDDDEDDDEDNDEKEDKEDKKVSNTNKPQNNSTYIRKARAKEIAFSHSGISASKARKLTIKMDSDDGIKVYNVEFISGNTEYEYEIDAISGEIREFDKDTNSISNNKDHEKADDDQDDIDDDDDHDDNDNDDDGDDDHDED